MGVNHRVFYFGMIIILHVIGETFSSVQSEVKCSKDSMEINIVKTSSQAMIYLQDFKHYPDEACRPKLGNNIMTFKLSLAEADISHCGIARVTNKLSGQKVYYHHVVVEKYGESTPHRITVKCIMTTAGNTLDTQILKVNHTAIRRSVLPAGFQEDDTIDIGGVISGMAPLPMLSVGVRQGGKLVTSELNVSPGTPLQMEIFLDDKSSPVYGLLVTYMQVTDTLSTEETIIFNGCSVDPYLFENFNTVNGDFLVAKFRAFKFPESTYVQFRGTVNVCLDKCQGVDCSNGQIGFGRKKRSVSMAANNNRIFEVTMSTFIKVDWNMNITNDDVFSSFIDHGKQQKNNHHHINDEVTNEFVYKVTKMVSSSASSFDYGPILSFMLKLIVLSIVN